MKRIAMMAALLAVMTTGLTAKELSLGSGIPMPDVKMIDISGKSISLNDAKGEEGLLVIFTCNTCPWVKRWEDRYVALAEQYRQKGLGVIAINSNATSRHSGDGLEDMQAQAREKGYNFHYAVDEGSRIALAFGATRTPQVFLFDKTGILTYRGAVDDNAKRADKVQEPYLQIAIDATLEGRPVEKSATKALGCTIKFPGD